MGTSLIILDGKQKGREVPLPETIFLIGRDAQCHLRPHCEAVSQLHCAIAAWGGKVRVRDLQSRNGTIVNGLCIRSEIEVQDGDELQIGTLRFRIKQVKGAAKHAAAPVGQDDQWLLYSSVDAPVLSPGFGTWVADVKDESPTSAPGKRTGKKQQQADTVDKRAAGIKSVSAGDQLIAHIEKKHHKKKPRVTE